MQHSDFYTLISLFINVLLMTFSAYLFTALKGWRRFSMLAYVLSYGCISVANIGLLLGLLESSAVYQFAYLINYISTSGLIFTLAMDRLFFFKGFTVRGSHNNKKQAIKP